ncbi:MAG: hypothetical protein DYG88_01860 [Chloroflexi bacterium CFX4]|nr:hypothetical protein [Chloroflexi bacterium CFX4]MDL1922397.1 hypothetical protein [Chloroflexi bacterium CFX3]
MCSGIVGVLIAGVLALGLWLVPQPMTFEDILPEISEETQLPSVDPALLTLYADLSEGKTEDGMYFIGAADAPATLVQFSSLSCPPCWTYTRNYIHQITDLMREDKVRVVFMPLPQYGSFNSTGAARGAICAGEQARFFDMADVLFSWAAELQERLNDDTTLLGAADLLNLDKDTFTACLASNLPDAVLAAAAREAEARRINATPSVFLNDVQIFPQRAGGLAGMSSLEELRALIEVAQMR